MGYRRAERADTPTVNPEPKNTYTINEPHPIEIYGEPKPISEKKVGKYLTDDAFHYINLYSKIKKFGLPHIYASWMDVPEWLLDLHDMFERVDLEYEHWLAGKQYNNN